MAASRVAGTGRPSDSLCIRDARSIDVDAAREVRRDRLVKAAQLLCYGSAVLRQHELAQFEQEGAKAADHLDAAAAILPDLRDAE